MEAKYGKLKESCGIAVDDRILSHIWSHHHIGRSPEITLRQHLSTSLGSISRNWKTPAMSYRPPGFTEMLKSSGGAMENDWGWVRNLFSVTQSHDGDLRSFNQKFIGWDLWFGVANEDDEGREESIEIKTKIPVGGWETGAWAAEYVWYFHLSDHPFSAKISTKWSFTNKKSPIMSNELD